MRFLLLLAQGLLAQSQLTTAATAAVAENTAPAAILPKGSGPIAPSRLANINFKTLEKAPAFVDELRMPAGVPTLLSRLRAMPNTQSQNSAAASLDIRRAMQAEIKNSGLLRPVINSSTTRKYTEDELAEVFAAGVMMAFDNTTDGPPTALTANGRRLLGFWGDLWDAITGAVKAVGCGAFATGALPGYLLAYSLFHSGNSGYNKLSAHQKYFARAGGFSTALLNKVNVKYGAWFAPGFGDASGVTMGSEIYIRGAKADADTSATTTMTLPGNFVSQTRLLMHEMGHSKQYESRGWKVGSFGWDYLYQFCKAGMSYSKNSMEKDAETYRDNSDALMSSPVTAHFKKWRKDNLASTGFCKSAKEYTNFKIGNTRIMSLDYTTNTAKSAESQRKEGTFCVRVLTGSQLNSRTQETIAAKPWDCVNQKPTKAPTKKPTAKPTKKPTKKPTAKPTVNPFVADLPIGVATRPPSFKIAVGTVNFPTPKGIVPQIPRIPPVP